MWGRIALSSVLACGAASGCVKYKPVQVRAGAGKGVYREGAPASLSGHIRTVMKSSREGSPAQEAGLDRLFEMRPELAALSARIEANPSDLDSRRLLAEALLGEGLHTHALLIFQEICERAPDHAAARLGLARIMDAWGDYGQARMHAERAVQLQPSSAVAHEWLGRICLHQQDAGAALEAFQAALRLSPGNARILANSGYLYLLRGEWEQARALLERSLEMDGSIPEARNHLGIVLAHLGEREAALEHFMAANDPASALNNLGTVYLGERRWKEAAEEFRRALKLQAGHARARANLRYAEARLPPPAVYVIKPFPEGESVDSVHANALVRLEYSEHQPLARNSLNRSARGIFGMPRLQDGARQGPALSPEPENPGAPSAPADNDLPAGLREPGQRRVELPVSALASLPVLPSGNGREPLPRAKAAEPVTKTTLPVVAEIGSGPFASDPVPLTNASPGTLNDPEPRIPYSPEISLSRAVPARLTGYAIQVMAARTEQDARSEKERLAKASLAAGVSKVNLERKGIWYRVRLYGYTSFKAALSAARKLASWGYIYDFWIDEDGKIG